MTFHPLVYETEEELQHFLSFPGSHNVTQKFYNMMMAGFIINIIYVMHVIYYKTLSSFETGVRKTTLTLNFLIILVASLAHFSLLIYFRFQHTGAVCSADWNYYMSESKDWSEMKNTPYEEYYLREEGDFIRRYILTIATVVFAPLCCICTCVYIPIVV